ncbi:glycerophosphodiester phosphodiesterase [Paenibacillus lycopersici]|uniref:Glycerophosphodiester phosphodiesterase n=1 Tax=Paenibacillus lycopersici TaxID=2704462 RepID=A0A6C0FW20_9BACL|nr:glycerophosphodiester phosphodiesterase [Paenibacillus lycopersici]QHT59643.1 glycerophosphodiester phosphodiesterase [Paenibacillus lycopersici]
MARGFPLITAHAGSMNIMAHTLQSVRVGIELGADVVEEDIRVTRDGVPVLAHDDEWMTAERQRVRIADMTYAELSGLQLVEVAEGEDRGEQAAGHDERITETLRLLKLEDILPLVESSGAAINLDLKVDAAIEPTAALVRQYGLSKRAFFSGCQRDRALLAEELQPDMRKLLNTDVELFRTMPYLEALAQTCEDARAAACFGINVYHGILRREFIDYAAGLGLPVYAWTVGDEALMHRYADWGVASITTRDVETLVRVKRERLGSLR